MFLFWAYVDVGLYSNAFSCSDEGAKVNNWLSKGPKFQEFSIVVAFLSVEVLEQISYCEKFTAWTRLRRNQPIKKLWTFRYQTKSSLL